MDWASKMRRSAHDDDGDGEDENEDAHASGTECYSIDCSKYVHATVEPQPIRGLDLAKGEKDEVSDSDSEVEEEEEFELVEVGDEGEESDEVQMYV
jgi:hypothetical protein